MKTALIIVDVQNDFFADGILAARDTPSLLAPLNTFVQRAFASGILCVFTKDWHPPNHSSFQQWPPHCVQNTFGAEYPAGLLVPESQDVLHIVKGVSPDSIGYSDFEETGLEITLRKKGITRVFITGIALEYCVKATALDALKNGFDTTVITDLTRNIEANTGDIATALAEMKHAGVKLFLQREVEKLIFT
jgi:nicotinamidase/pyrazinamidase